MSDISTIAVRFSSRACPSTYSRSRFVSSNCLPSASDSPEPFTIDFKYICKEKLSRDIAYSDLATDRKETNS